MFSVLEEGRNPWDKVVKSFSDDKNHSVPYVTFLSGVWLKGSSAHSSGAWVMRANSPEATALGAAGRPNTTIGPADPAGEPADWAELGAHKPFMGAGNWGNEKKRKKHDSIFSAGGEVYIWLLPIMRQDYTALHFSWDPCALWKARPCEITDGALDQLLRDMGPSSSLPKF